MKAKFVPNAGANMSNMTEVEQELLLRYLSGEINQTQFEFLIHQEGLDKDRMYKLADDVESRVYSLTLVAACILGIIVVLVTVCLMKLITPL
jgi:hypothetical protein